MTALEQEAIEPDGVESPGDGIRFADDTATVPWHGLDLVVPLGGGSGSALRFAHRLITADGKRAKAEVALRRDPQDTTALGLRSESGLMSSAAVFELLESALGEDQMGRLIEVADQDVNVDEIDLIRLAGTVNAVRAARPTKPSTGSSGGRSLSGDGSTGGGSGSTAPVARLTPRQQQKQNEAGLMAPVAQAVTSYT